MVRSGKSREPVRENASPLLHQQENKTAVTLEPLNILFSVCKVADYSGIEIDRSGISSFTCISNAIQLLRYLFRGWL